ncbi:M14 family metallopeptidase [Maribellus maritimus]|uniref:M14 family metallopeptidase n=1 Tax=Maribellus maritimus TaxID=2870838 RepID=UPI001EEABBDA|nr:M14 family metallopeptidase [Maribellus maritimus]MCG6186692.1 hypothetical protein [Maribellus maritimus]
MKKNAFISILSFLFMSLFVWNCSIKETKWKGQAPIQRVNTETRPVQYQLKKTFNLGAGIFCSNNFEGARLNGAVLTHDTLLTVLVTPENTPINSSPWYAFKIWSETPKNVRLKITYNEGVSHRYYPKVSNNGKNWKKIDSTLYFLDSVSLAKEESPKFCEMNLSLSSDTLWIAAQELITSKQINSWAMKLAEKPFVSMFEIGKSFEGRPINAMQIGNRENKKLIMVLSRQHPPEVTGWLAMKWFVETLCSETKVAEEFRNEYTTFVVPLANPDGVDNGNWRHGSGGIDLNRDWESFNQPETQAIRDFMKTTVSKGGTFYFGVDFHSTFEDIYYTVPPEQKGNMPGLVPDLITAVGDEIPGYEPNIRPSDINEPKINSTKYFFYEFGAEAVTYEIGDDTPRELIQKKGKTTALNLIRLMLKE